MTQDNDRTGTVSSLTKTPWGDIIPRKTSTNSRPGPPDSKLKLGQITKAAPSSEGTPSGGARTSPSPKPPAPGDKPALATVRPTLDATRPKPSPPGPKPVILGPKPKLPGPKPKLPGPKPKLPGPKPKLPAKPNTSPPEQQKSQNEHPPNVSPIHPKESLVTSDDWTMIDHLNSSPRFPRPVYAQEKQTSFPFPDTKTQVNGLENEQHQSPCDSPLSGTPGRYSPSTPSGSPRKQALTPPSVPRSPSPLAAVPPMKSGGSATVARLVGTFQQPSASTATSVTSARNDTRASTLPLLSRQARNTSSSSPSVFVDDFEEPEQGRSRLSAMGGATHERRLRMSSPIGGSFERLYHKQEDMHSLEVQRLSVDLSADSSDESPRNSPTGSTSDVPSSALLHPLLARQLSPPRTAEEPTTPNKPDVSPEELVSFSKHKCCSVSFDPYVMLQVLATCCSVCVCVCVCACVCVCV